MKCYRLPALLLIFLVQYNLLFAQTADQTKGCAAFTVSFTPPSGQSSFFWEFGDGITSTQDNASHIYANPGNYTVIFRNMVGGAQVGNSISIEVYPKPTIEITADPPGGCAPLSTQLTATVTADPSIILTNYLWDFGDTQSDNGANLSTVAHDYLNPGDYDPAVSIETNYPTCNVLEQAIDLVSASGPPGVGFLTNPNPPFSCTAPLTVNFTNISLDQQLSWSWDFGNGVTSTDLNPPAQTYTAEGNYTVTLVGTDANNCSGTSSIIVSIGEPLADFSPAQDTICLGSLPIPMMNNSSAGTYAWTFDNGAFPATSTQTSPLVQFNNPGVTNITLTVTSLDGNCSSMTTGSVFVEDADASFISVPTYSCNKTLNAQFTPNNLDGAQYIWTFDEFGTSNDMSPTFTYENLDTTTHSINDELIFNTTLTIVTNAGCTATFTQMDTIYQPNALFFPDVTEGCVPLEVNFENRSSNDYDLVEFVWDFGDGTVMTLATDDDQTHTYTAPGEYDVVLTIRDELGCLDTSFVQTIEVGDALSPDFTLSATSICPGDSITLQSINNSDLIDAWHFATDANRAFHCYQEDVLTHVFDTETGMFDATLIVEYNGCYSEVTQTDAIEVRGPIAHIDWLVDCADPFNISFRDSSDEATSVTWDFGDLQTSNLDDPTHMYADTGDYQIVLTAVNNASGCPASVDTATVYVRDIQADFNLDSLLCLGIPYSLNGGNSINVDADCHTGYTWYFSDPNDRPITTQESATDHIFEQVGINYVTLITDDINGCRDTIIDTVKVFGVYPELMAMPSPICIPSTVTFSSMGTTADTTIDNYMWDFGDGNTSDLVNPTHTYTTQPVGGSFNVTLTVEDVIPCSGAGVLEIPVYIPESEITASPSLNICVGDQINFSASDFTAQGSNLNWTWDFGSGATPATGTGQNNTVTYNTAGTFAVILNYQEVGSNCTGIPDTVFVSVQDYPIANFTSTVDGQATICAPEIITFSDASQSNFPLTVNWDLAGVAGSGVEVTNTFNRGTHIINHTVSTSNGCSDTSADTLTLIGPEGTLVISDNTICYGEEIEFTIVDTIDAAFWTIDFGDGVTIDTTSPVTHIYPGPFPGDSTIVQLLLDDNNGCQVTNNIPVYFESVDVAFAGFPFTGCVGEELIYNAVSQNATTFFWDFGDGTTSNEQTTSHAFSDTLTYTITLEVENALGCTGFIEGATQIEAVPDLQTPEPVTVCADETADLEVIGGGTDLIYSWEPANFVTSPMQASTSTNVLGAELPSNNFEFTVTGSTALAGCSDTESLFVTTIPQFVAPDIDSFSVCPGQELPLPVTNPGAAFDFTWSVQGEDLSDAENMAIIDRLNAGDNNPVLLVPPIDGVDRGAAEVIQVTLTATVPSEPNSTCNGSWTFDVNLLATNTPNAFTPNGDGRNDFFDFPVREFYDIRTFQVFNRWGQKIYDNDTPATGWDGTFNGNEAASEVYIYIFETTNDECVFRGNVSLIR